ncbi:MAG: hypothetical protein CVV42_19170 [Candidatus Riflebacteria bacterium HGW-Riflebacteria-2]|jgi:hypothetical protein|nr:MAG: hypothetical protein CVV42_19170 [Candidatus Riflebacteria bacterium HGW-Riflebacteria-2]
MVCPEFEDFESYTQPLARQLEKNDLNLLYFTTGTGKTRQADGRDQESQKCLVKNELYPLLQATFCQRC